MSYNLDHQSIVCSILPDLQYLFDTPVMMTFSFSDGYSKYALPI